MSKLNLLIGNYKNIIDAVAAFLPFLIALFMAYIAYQQWRTNEQKRKQDLFNLRWECYTELKSMYEDIVTGDYGSFDETDLFLQNNRYDRARFLFDEEVAEHLTQMGKNANGFSYTWFCEPFEKYLKLEKEEYGVTIWCVLIQILITLYNFFIPFWIQKIFLKFKNLVSVKYYKLCKKIRMMLWKELKTVD